MENIFKKHYHNLDNLYCDYVIGEEYAENPLVKEVNKLSGLAMDEALKLCKYGKYNDAEDNMLKGIVAHEEMGFLLGFSYAMKIAQESIRNIWKD